MFSPFTGKKMVLMKEPTEINYNNETYNIIYHYYLCIDTNAKFTDDELDNININQILCKK